MNISDAELQDLINANKAILRSKLGNGCTYAPLALSALTELQEFRELRRWRKTEDEGRPTVKGEYKVIYTEWSGGGTDNVTWPEFARWFDDVEYWRQEDMSLPEA